MFTSWQILPFLVFTNKRVHPVVLENELPTYNFPATSELSQGMLACLGMSILIRPPVGAIYYYATRNRYLVPSASLIASQEPVSAWRCTIYRDASHSTLARASSPSQTLSTRTGTRRRRPTAQKGRQPASTLCSSQPSDPALVSVVCVETGTSLAYLCDCAQGGEGVCIRRSSPTPSLCLVLLHILSQTIAVIGRLIGHTRSWTHLSLLPPCRHRLASYCSAPTAAALDLVHHLSYDPTLTGRCTDGVFPLQVFLTFKAPEYPRRHTRS